jgi:regulator of protease activity HflC (stomatin/prohibitin superfamily)
MNVRIQKATMRVPAASKDLEDTVFTILLHYNIIPEKAPHVFQNIGIVDYKESVIDPLIHEVVKAVTAQYNAEELIIHREKILSEIKKMLKARMLEYGFFMVDAFIVNIEFSDEFTRMIENQNKI